ncbi:unnamed protein product [Phytophthora lilii]|uniref:Unnamed protein product n=1 Tax=Phytophthora lilii TaxID=2077276 RepID=A0A9W7D0S2_9STRA|nr:unnamed protein product [Phytophthora lilii]
MNCKDYLYEIDCKLTQYCYPMEEPDQGYFIRQQLIREIEDYSPNLSTICKDYLYEIDCKLTQYCYPMEEPDQGYYIRQQLMSELRTGFIYHQFRVVSKINNHAKAVAYLNRF